MTSLSRVEGELLVQRLGDGRFIGYLPNPSLAPATRCGWSVATAARVAASVAAALEAADR